MTDAVVVVVVAAVSVLRLDVICEPGVKVGRKVALVAFVLQPIAVALSDVTLQRLEAVELGGAELAGVDIFRARFVVRKIFFVARVLCSEVVSEI